MVELRSKEACAKCGGTARAPLITPFSVLSPSAGVLTTALPGRCCPHHCMEGEVGGARESSLGRLCWPKTQPGQKSSSVPQDNYQAS